MTAYILNFDSEHATLENAGGKGANLVRLFRAGFPVPHGFIVTTQAYRDYVNANALAGKISRAFASLPMDNPDALESASSSIRQAFSDGTMPAPIAQEIVAAYSVISREQRDREIAVNDNKISRRIAARNDDLAVAVRSSATAEDLPKLSFAGQQETYLNVIGEKALLDAIVKCWSSLWTARAVDYRARNHISQTDAVLAVVVQQMVQSETSGVMFTANPLTGSRAEIVIEATLGLGEALVSGQIDPDNYIVDIARKTITTKSLGAKTIVVRGKAGSGTVTQEQNAAQQQALPDAQIIELAELGKRVTDQFGSPQDIEWAWANGKLFLLQARPITTM